MPTKIQHVASWLVFTLCILLGVGVGFYSYLALHLSIMLSAIAALLWIIFSGWCQLTGIEGGLPGLANLYNDWGPLKNMDRPAASKSIAVSIGCISVLLGTAIAVNLWNLSVLLFLIELILMTIFICPFASVMMERWD